MPKSGKIPLVPQIGLLSKGFTGRQDDAGRDGEARNDAATDAATFRPDPPERPLIGRPSGYLTGPLKGEARPRHHMDPERAPQGLEPQGVK